MNYFEEVIYLLKNAIVNKWGFCELKLNIVKYTNLNINYSIETF